MGSLGAGKASLFMKAIKVVYSFKENAQKILRITGQFIIVIMSKHILTVVKVFIFKYKEVFFGFLYK